MNIILFTCKYFTIRVKEVVGIIILLLLLFFGFNACQSNEKEKIKEKKIENICEFTNENINDFNQLLSRTDLCSDGWFKDLDDYIARLEDQNTYLKKRDKEEYQKVLEYQEDILEELKFFKEDQSDENIDKLEKVFKDYKAFYEGKCKQGKKVVNNEKEHT